MAVEMSATQKVLLYLAVGTDAKLSWEFAEDEGEFAIVLRYKETGQKVLALAVTNASIFDWLEGRALAWGMGEDVQIALSMARTCFVQWFTRPTEALQDPQTQEHSAEE